MSLFYMGIMKKIVVSEASVGSGAIQLDKPPYRSVHENS
jgi:hypothetical protein